MNKISKLKQKSMSSTSQSVGLSIIRAASPQTI